MHESRTKKANGEGYLSHDAARGRWRGAVAWTDPDGTPRRKHFSGPTREAVVKSMNRLRSELGQGRAPASERKLGEYLTGWLEAERARVRPATWRYRDGHVRLYVVPALGGTKLGALTPRHVETMTAACSSAACRPGRRSAAGPRSARPWRMPSGTGSCIATSRPWRARRACPAGTWST